MKISTGFVLIGICVLVILIPGNKGWEDCDHCQDEREIAECRKTCHSQGHQYFHCLTCDGKYTCRCVVDNYDLSSQDLDALCEAVDPSNKHLKTPSCIYMKWVPCGTGEVNPKRPCGHYKQAKCGDENARRVKRGIVMEPEIEERGEETIMGFPEDA